TRCLSDWSSDVCSSDLSLESLPQAEQEVKAIGEIYGAQESTILIGNAAREETFKATAANYPVLHFAAHGVLDDANPLYSRLLLEIGRASCRERVYSSVV